MKAVGKYTRSIDTYEDEISNIIRRYRSDEMLLLIHQVVRRWNTQLSKFLFYPNPQPPNDPPLFALAGLASMSVRWSNPHRDKKPSMEQFRFALREAGIFLTFDPISFDESIRNDYQSSEPYPAFLRLMASQFYFSQNFFPCHARSLILYEEILPKSAKDRTELCRFDFHQEFSKLYEVSLFDFVSTSFVAYCASKGNTCGFTNSYFRKAREDGVLKTNDETISKIINKISADPDKFRKAYDKMKQNDRRFRMYDFNPLLSYPLLKPWKGVDRMVAPLPELILHRISEGIYYEMLTTHGTRFTEWFGYLFEEYVGEILRNSVSSDKIWTEEMIKQKFPKYRGRVVDWQFKMKSV
jgi:hypothetical protein